MSRSNDAVISRPAMPDYGSIIIAGYSLGSGHAVYWAKAKAYASFHYREADHSRLDRYLRVWKASGVPGNQRSHVFLDVTDGYDFATQTPWPLWTADQHKHAYDTPVPGACTEHQAAAADGCLEVDATSSLPLVFPHYMNLFCAAGGDL